MSHREHSFRPKTGGCSKQVSQFYEFRNKLFSLDRYNLEQLTEFAYSAVSLDVKEETWRYLWENEEFLTFIDTCADHPPAEMHVVTLLNSKETARVTAPRDVLAKFGITPDDFSSDEEIPTLVYNLSEVKELMRGTVNCDHLLQVLKDSVKGNAQLERKMKAAKSLIHWSPERGTFDSPWCIDTVKQALANIEQYEKKRAERTRHRLMKTVPKPGGDSSHSENTGPPEPYWKLVTASISKKHDVESERVNVSEVVPQDGRPKPSDNDVTVTNESATDQNAFSCRAVLSLRESLFGDQLLDRVTQMEYYRIAEILPKPEVKETQLRGFVGKVLPYILQRVKMRGCHVLHPSTFATLVRGPPMSAYRPAGKYPFGAKCKPTKKGSTTQFACPVSRLDCFSTLLDTVDNIVARDLIHVMSQFPMALPLVRRNVSDACKYILMTTLLRGAAIKWETASGKIVEHSLFDDPFKLLVAVRLGNNDTGKSAILNQILARDNAFSRKGEPGSDYGKPATVDGSVEFIWLTPETCKPPLWEMVMRHGDRGDSTINLLANVHGNATENPDVIALFNHCFECRYLAFLMPDCNETQWQEFTAMIPSQEHVSFVRVDPDDYDVTEPFDIQSSKITEDNTLRKVRSCLDEALKRCSVVKYVNADMECPLISLADGIETELSQKIIDYVAHYTCKATKGQLRLQNSFGKSSVKHLSTTSHSVVINFIEILLSPLHVAQRAVIHVENDLSRLCNAETQKVRREFSSLRADLNKAIANPQSDPKDIERLRRNVSDTLNIIDDMNLGSEHFFREVGYLYQLQLTSKTHNDELLSLPQKVAELFVNGHPLELLDGDSGHIQMPWLNGIFKSIAEKHPKLRLFVISIIGLQSSGKSTLLNSLFACRFAVSVGRCSRGLFMRLLSLDEKLAKAWKVDAILLIDTEGLGSPEKMGDDEAEKKDRLLATFVMGISNLAIVNVLGEYMKELTEIMQIAVVTMTRLEQADIAPDMLMVQHLLTEKNSDKLCQGEQQFCEAIRNAIDLAEKRDVQVGVRSAKCLRELFDRIKNGTLLTQFHPYKDGATANAPASEAYHTDVVGLYQKILGCCKSSKSVIELRKWKTLLESYWDCVTQEDFALRFKNVKEIHDFIDRGQRISCVKQAIDAAFSAHARKEKARIIARIREIDNKSSHQDRGNFLRDMVKLINVLPHGCMANASIKCQQCKEGCERQKALYEHVQDGPHELETMKTITEFTDIVRKSTIQKLSQSFDACVMQQGCCAEFDDIITSHLRRHLEKCDPGAFTDAKRKQIIDEILAKLSETARDKNDDKTVREKIADAILVDYRQSHDILGRFNSEFSKFEDVLQSYRRRGVHDFVQGVKVAFFGGDQNAQEVKYLKSMTDSVLRKMVDQRQADCYEHGMVSELNQELTRQLDEFCTHKMRLTPEQKLNIHVWTLQQFCKRMEEMQTAWDKKNKPSSILRENADRYVQIIKTRLEYGFTCFGEARIIGQHFLRGAQKKAILAENNEKTKDVESLVWTTNSEKVRLKYFKHLAEQVRDGKQDAALAHFRHPTKHIEKWYKETVDQHRGKSFGETYSRTFTQEFTSVRQKVENAEDSDCIASLAEEYNDFLELQSYQPSPILKADMTCVEDLETMKAEIVRTIKANKDKYSVVDDSVFSSPSAETCVMARLGCTARCFWCGALCWGQRGHEDDRGETKKHHSSHQPGGLARVHSKRSDHLISQPCHDTKDDTVVHFGEYQENGIPWKDAKEKHFSEWKFDRHYIAKFDALMRWFFQELHHSIAKNTENLKPATKDDLERYNCTNLSYDDIIGRIEQEIT